MRPLAIELFAGLHGWGAGLSAAGFRVVGFDIADMPGMLNHPVPEHCSLVLQDVRTLHGSQFRDAHLIVASPPCTEFSFMAMPFHRGKQISCALRGKCPYSDPIKVGKCHGRGDCDFPEGYTGSRTIAELTALFDACFRIQREASEAAGRYIPMVVENVRGAQPWVGRAKWNYGSYYLWGDVPAPMPSTLVVAKNPGQDWNRYKQTGEVSPHWRMEALNVVPDHIKQGGSGAAWFDKAVDERRKAAAAAVKQHQAEHVKVSGDWFGSHAEMKAAGKISPGRLHGKGSPARRAASALIAKIPLALAEHIGRVYYPHGDSCAQRDQRAKKAIEKIGELV